MAMAAMSSDQGIRHQRGVFDFIKMKSEDRVRRSTLCYQTTLSVIAISAYLEARKICSGLEDSGRSYPVRIFGLEKNIRSEIICQPSEVISGKENDGYISTGTDLEQ